MYVACRVGHQKISTVHDFYSLAEKTGGYNLANMVENTLEGSEISPKDFNKAAEIAAKLFDEIG